MSTPLRGRSLVVAAAVCGGALAVPFWTGHFLPLLDLPQHLAVVSVLRHHGDPAWGFGAYFEPQWTKLTPYWTFYLVTYGLSFLTSVETASRLYLTLYAVAFPWAGIALARAFGRSPWVGLLAAPLALNTNLYYGFVSYCSGVVVLLFLLADFENGLGRERFGFVRHALGAAILFFTHVQTFAFYVAAAALLALTRRDVDARRRWRRFAVVLPAVLLLLLPWVYRQVVAPRDGGGHYVFGHVGRMGARFLPLGDAVRQFPEGIAGSFQDHSDLWIFAAWALLASASLAFARGGGRVRPAVLAVLAFGAYFLAPLSVTGQWNIGPRFALLAVLLAIPLLTVSARASTVVGASAVALTLATAANAAWHHAAFDRETGDFGAVLECVPRGSRVMPLIFENRGRVVTEWPYLHFGQYAMVRRGGMTSSNLGRYEPFPILLRNAKSWPVLDPFRPQDFRDAGAGARYEYFIVRDVTSAAVMPDASAFLVCAHGAWSVYRGPL